MVLYPNIYKFFSFLSKNFHSFIRPWSYDILAQNLHQAYCYYYLQKWTTISLHFHDKRARHANKGENVCPNDIWNRAQVLLSVFDLYYISFLKKLFFILKPKFPFGYKTMVL